MTWEKQLALFFEENFPELGNDVFQRLVAFGNEVLKWNRATNLISRKNPAITLARQIADSLFLLHILRGDESFLDIGAGAGFPSIPVMLGSQARGTLCEARKRRAAFLEYIIRHLEIAETRLLCQTITPDSPLEESGFDCLWSKAGIRAETLFACSARWVRDGGTLFLLRPFHSPEEETNLESLATRFYFTYDSTRIFESPSLDLTRTLTVFRKDSHL